MDRNGMPIPEGGKKSLSLTSQGFPPSSQMREASFACTGGENIKSTNFDEKKNTYQNDCQLLLNSVQNSFDRRTDVNQNNPQQKQRALPTSRLSPMAKQAHINMLKKKMENLKPNHGKQPLVEKHAEGAVLLPEIFSVDSAYKPGKGAERLTQYMFQQRNRPKDNNIQFWRNLVAEFFAPGAKKRWCVSLYKNAEQIDTLFKVEWQCNMCNQKPCYGFDISEELLPRLHKTKYDTGLLEEHLQIDTPSEYQGACGQIFLHYPKAAEESQYEQVRIVRNGQLRLVFSPDLKIRSWEFCAQDHEEYIRRNSIVPQVSQLGAAMQNYRLSTQDSSSATPEEIQKHSDLFISSAHQMVEALGVPIISQIGVAKRYTRCLQISEVLNIMHGLIDYSQEYGVAPKESIAKYPRFGSNVSSGKKSDQQPELQQSPVASSAPSSKAFAGDNGLCNTTTSKRQRTRLSSPYAVTPAQIMPIHSSTPLLDLQPQVAHTTLAKSGTESATGNNHSPRIVQRIIQEVTTAQPYNGSDGTIGVRNAENKNENIATFGNNIYGGNSVASNVIPKNVEGNCLPQEDDDHLLDEFVDFEGVHELLQ